MGVVSLLHVVDGRIVLYLSEMDLIEYDLVWVSNAVESRNESQDGNYHQGNLEVPVRLRFWRDLVPERVDDGLPFAVARFLDIGARGSRFGLLLASLPHCSLRS